MENGLRKKPNARKESGAFAIPMLVLTIALVIGIVILALFLRVKFCGGEDPAGQGSGQQSQASARTPDGGVPEDVIRAFVSETVRENGTTDFTIGSLQHGIDKAKKTDTVTFVLTETRPNGVFRSRHIVSFAYDAEKSAWTVRKHDQTKEEQIEGAEQSQPTTPPPSEQSQPTTPPPSEQSQPTTPPPSQEAQTTTPPPEELPDRFTFGGAVISRGEKDITGSKRGINGPDAEHPVHITAEEVEMLIKLCPDLEVLDLDSCYMDDYAPLGKLTKLKKLVLTRCGTETKGNRIRSIEWIAGLKNLEILYLTHNDVSDLSPLAGLHKLEELRVGRNKLTGDSLAGLRDLPKLKYLSINANYGIKTLSKLPSLENLRSIDASVCEGLTSLDGMRQQPRMKMLKLDYSGVRSLEGVSSQPALVEIDLSGCDLSLSEYRKLEKCPKLTYVVIREKDKTANEAMDTVEKNNSRISRLYEWKYIGG
ncbi:MAG: hypothetical protein IJJ86_01595 [Clostridia bacterium]|nr:hypothetical protein [Clostridia bacterium]